MTRRSLAAKCRRLSSSRSTYVSKVGRFLTGASGLTLGMGIGYLVFGDMVAMLEMNRQKHIREDIWRWIFNPKIEDLREKMWPELREKTWFQNMERTCSDLKEKIKPYTIAGLLDMDEAEYQRSKREDIFYDLNEA